MNEQSNRTARLLVWVLVAALLCICLAFFTVGVVRAAQPDSESARGDFPALQEYDYTCIDPLTFTILVEMRDCDGPSRGAKVSALLSPAREPQRAAPAQMCPAGTMNLFPYKTELEVGTGVNANGVVTAIAGEWQVSPHEGKLLARNKSNGHIIITFPNNVHISRIVVYDHDPKTYEQPWTLNDITLPQTLNKEWGQLDLTYLTNQIAFDNGDDSAHFTVCLTISQ